MDQQQEDILLIKALEGSLDPREKTDFESLISANPLLKNRFEQMQTAWSKSASVTQFKRIDGFRECDFTKVLSKIRNRNGKKEATPVRHLTLNRSVAASLALIIVTSTFYLLYNYVPGFGKWDAVTAKNSIEIVELPDKSTVSLNKHSRLVYLHSANSAQRIVKLNGEAFFDVQKNPEKPFVVKLGETQVKVLGTSFNIKQHDNGKVEVTVSEGKVSFGNRNDGLTLVKNEKGVYENGKFKKVRVFENNQLFWKTGEIVFTNNTLEEVAKVLNDSFDNINNVDIVSTDSTTRLTTRFAKQSLPEIFEELSVHFNKKFTLKDGTLVISD